MSSLRTSRTPALAVVALGLALGLLAGCGSDDDATGGSSPTPSATPVDTASLLGTTYESTSVEGHELVADTSIRLAFEDDTMSVSAGCNTQFGPYALTDGKLAWTGEPASTVMGCLDGLAGQDEWLRELFTTGVRATYEGTSLLLDSGDVTIEMGRAPQADLGDLLGRTWSVVGTISDGTTSRLPGRTRTPRLVVGADGLARIDTGCNTGRTTVQVSRTAISFGRPAITRVACQEPDSAIEQIVLSVVDGPTDFVEFDGAILIAVKGDNGLVFQVR